MTIRRKLDLMLLGYDVRWRLRVNPKSHVPDMFLIFIVYGVMQMFKYLDTIPMKRPNGLLASKIFFWTPNTICTHAMARIVRKLFEGKSIEPQRIPLIK